MRYHVRLPLIRPLAFLLCLLSAQAWGADWVMRAAAGGEYGTEDGTSYANAFDGDTDAWADTSHIDSGDTLYICGTWREVVTIQDTGVTVRLDCPAAVTGGAADPAILDGSDIIDNTITGDQTTGWEDISGEYCRDMLATNGAVSGKIASGLDRPWGVERPSGPPSLAAMASGALFAGRYQVAVTFVGTTGEESGCGLNEPVDVADGGGISVTKIPQPISGFVNRIRIYVTEANGEVPYHYADLAVGTTALFIGRSLTLGMALATQFLMPPVPGYALEHYNGRIYIARSNLLFFTEAMAYGHMRQQNFLAFDDEVRIVKAADPGIFVATASRTFFLQGSGPADFQLLDRLSYGAARGAVAELPGRRILWIGAKGPVVATQDGEIEGLTDDQESALRHLAMDDHERGSVAVRDRDGVRQIVAAMGSEVASSMTAQDYFDIEIIRKT